MRTAPTCRWRICSGRLLCQYWFSPPCPGSGPCSTPLKVPTPLISPSLVPLSVYRFPLHSLPYLSIPLSPTLSLSPPSCLQIPFSYYFDSQSLFSWGDPPPPPPPPHGGSRIHSIFISSASPIFEIPNLTPALGRMPSLLIFTFGTQDSVITHAVICSQS